jgi:hypothetical protein
MYLFGANAAWDTPLGVHISRYEGNFKILLGRVFVTIGEYKRQVVVKNDDIRR